MTKSEFLDTLYHRLYPGEGAFDCRGFIDAIEQAGFRSFYGVEVINEGYRKLPLGEQAENGAGGKGVACGAGALGVRHIVPLQSVRRVRGN